MSELIIQPDFKRIESAPDKDGTEQRDPAAQSAQRTPRFLTRDECLAKLSMLPALVTYGVLTPAQANCIRSALQAILAELRHRPGTSSTESVPLTEGIGRHGTTIVLKSIAVGARRLTTRQWIKDFIEACTEAASISR